MKNGSPHWLVSDFDGTMTRYDFFDLARRTLPSAGDRDDWGEYVAGRITHFEALAGIFGAIRADRARLEATADRMELSPGFRESVEALQNAGWRIVVASAGCGWYIGHHLRKAGVQLEVHASPGEVSADGGLRMSPPLDDPFYRRETGIDKAAVVRHALTQDADAVFAGDGRPDLEPARLVRPDRRFARGWLANRLREEGEEFRPFETWGDIAKALLKETPPC